MSRQGSTASNDDQSHASDDRHVQEKVIKPATTKSNVNPIPKPVHDRQQSERHPHRILDAPTVPVDGEEPPSKRQRTTSEQDNTENDVHPLAKKNASSYDFETLADLKRRHPSVFEDRLSDCSSLTELDEEEDAVSSGDEGTIYHDPYAEDNLPPSTNKSTPPIWIRPAPSEFKPGEKAVPDEFAMGEHLYVAALLQVVNVVNNQTTNIRRRKNQDTWCKCRKADDHNKMIECEDPKCPIGWWHLGCVDKMEYTLAEEWSMWVCEFCWRKRCVQFFQAHPRAWYLGVSGIENVPDAPDMIKKISRAADSEEVRKAEEDKLEMAVAGYRARKVLETTPKA